MTERPGWMGPTVTIDEALRSDAKRAERDRQLAAWCAHLIDPELLLARLRVFDARSEVWEVRQAAEEARMARLDADLADFWHDYGAPGRPARRRSREIAGGDGLRVRLVERL